MEQQKVNRLRAILLEIAKCLTKTASELDLDNIRDFDMNHGAYQVEYDNGNYVVAIGDIGI